MTTPGWHPDPQVPGQLRYWDGTAWTEHRSPAGSPRAPLSYGPRVVSDQRRSPGLVVVAWVLTVLTAGYFLPWAIAETRGKSNSLSIGLVNFLLGWTVIGWVVALVMACASHQRAVVPG